MNQVCKGVIFTKEAFTSVMLSGGEDLSAIDPEGLLASKDDDFKVLPGKDDWPASWEGVIASCRAWYDAKNWGKAFCCQGSETSGEWGSEPGLVFNTGKTASADPIDVSFGEFEVKINPYAEAFKSATRLGGVAIVMAAVTLMQ